MFVCILAALSGAQAIDTSVPTLPAGWAGLSIDLSSRSELRADTGARLRSEDGIARLTSTFVNSFLQQDHLTAAAPEPVAGAAAPAIAIPVAALAAAHRVPARIASIAAAAKR